MKLNAIVSALLHYVLYVTVYCQTKESEVRLLFRILASQHLLRDDMYGLVPGGDAVCPVSQNGHVGKKSGRFNQLLFPHLPYPHLHHAKMHLALRFP